MRITLSSLVIVATFAGCGYKGPLYLPTSKPAVVQKPATVVTPATSVEPAPPVSPGAPGIPATPGTPPSGSTPAAPQSGDPIKR